MLTQYQNQTAALLQNPAAQNPLYPTTQLTTFINSARGQLAGDAECIRPGTQLFTLALVVGQRNYPFSTIDVSSVNGVAGVFNVRQVLLTIGAGMRWVRPRPFEWFTFYRLNNVVPPSGPTNEWAQLGQGETGGLWVDPLPDNTYQLNIDATCVPIPLVDDSTVEAIPYPWSDCVSYFAAYLALLASQVPARQADADRMLARYEEFKNRARRYSTPSVLPGLYPQNPDPTRINKLGVQVPRGAAAGGGG